jgi:hypothetical protein
MTSLKSWESVPYNQCSVHSGACAAILQQEIGWFDQDKNTTVAWWPLMIISGCKSGTGIAVVNQTLMSIPLQKRHTFIEGDIEHCMILDT